MKYKRDNEREVLNQQICIRNKYAILVLRLLRSWFWNLSWRDWIGVGFHSRKRAGVRPSELLNEKTPRFLVLLAVKQENTSLTWIQIAFSSSSDK